MYDSFSKISRPSTGFDSRLFLKNIDRFLKKSQELSVQVELSE
jgi:hypothetical protein